MDSPSVDDEGLLTNFLETGDRQSLDALFRRHLDSAYRVAVRIIRTETEAEDVVQTAFVQVITKARQYRTGASVKGWILGIIVNTALNHMRSSARRRKNEMDSGNFWNRNTNDDLDQEEIQATVRGAVENLPEHERLPIFLRFMEGLSFTEVAAALHIPESTARAQVHRGIEHLRERLHGFGRPIGAAIIASALAASTSEAASPALAATVAQIAHAAVPAAAKIGGVAGFTAIATNKLIVGVLGTLAALGTGMVLLAPHSAISSGNPPTAPGLIAHFTFDEAAGLTATDSSGNGNSGTLVNGASWTRGETGGGLSLDGVNDYVIISSSPALNSIKTRMTVALWVFRRSKHASEMLLGRRMGPDSSDLWGLCYVRERYGFGVATMDNGGGGAGAPFAESDLNAWIHLAGVYDGGNVRLYRNGALQAAGPYSGIIPDERSPITIGAGDNGSEGIGEFSDSVIDDVRIYNRALSAKEIQEIASRNP